MTTPALTWINHLRTRLDALEEALLGGDASGVERASERVQAVLKGAPKTVEFGQADSLLQADMRRQAQRFGQLRQAVLRANAHNERALRSLMPAQAKPATYGRSKGLASTGGAGQTFLSA